MLRVLDVYLHRRPAGQLIQDEHGQMTFRYASSWLGAPDAVPMSHSLPRYVADCQTSFPIPDKMILFSCRSRAACYSVVRSHCRGDQFIFTHGTDHSFGRVVPRGISVSSRMISHGSSNKLVSCLDTPSASGKSMGTAASGSCRAVQRPGPGGRLPTWGPIEFPRSIIQ